MSLDLRYHTAAAGLDTRSALVAGRAPASRAPASRAPSSRAPSRPDLSWRHGAACLGSDSSVFFPADDAGEADESDESQVALAKAICATCTVRACCLQHALDHREHHGIWGGATEAERRRILRQRRRRLASAG